MAGFYSARGRSIPPLPWPTFAPPLSPLGVGINTAAIKAFDRDGTCIDSATQAQLRVLAEQVVTFARFSKATAPANTAAA